MFHAHTHVASTVLLTLTFDVPSCANTAANASVDAAHSDATPARTDRKSADAIYLSTANLSSELSRVNSTPLSSEDMAALGLPPSPSSSSIPQDPLNEPSPLTMAPPKPGPADTLYPSPSGGFVPSPEEGQDWRLKPPPPGRTNKDASLGSTSSLSISTPSSASSPNATSLTLPTVKEAAVQPSTSGLSPTLAPTSSTPTRPPSLPSCPETASKIANASSSSASRRSSQASNSSHLLDYVQARARRVRVTASAQPSHHSSPPLNPTLSEHLVETRSRPNPLVIPPRVAAQSLHALTPPPAFRRRATMTPTTTCSRL